MKKHARFILVTIATALHATTHAVAKDPKWQAIGNHHGGYTNVSHPVGIQTTLAFGGHARGADSTAPPARQTSSNPSAAKSGFREVSTPHGTVSYFVPVE